MWNILTPPKTFKMPKVKTTSKQGLRLPADFLRRRNLPADMEYWLD
jgi:hypothetical protein